MKTQTTNTIITAGKKYVDIDAYASMIVYRELLKSLGRTNTYAISTAKLNSSIPMFLRDSTYKLDASINTRNTTSVVLVDVSNPDFIDESVSKNSIVEVIDHHTGFENYWKSQIGVKTQIELIGSVCTMIFERILSMSSIVCGWVTFLHNNTL